MCDLWWKKRHWDRHFSEFFGFALPISFHSGPPYSYIIWGMNKRPVGGRSSETQSHHIDMNNNASSSAVVNTVSNEMVMSSDNKAMRQHELTPRSRDLLEKLITLS
jgi:hypothetical protein